jgi:hypothetical protein
MASTINAQTTPFAAIVQEADSTGNLAFQTANVTALTINTSQNVGIGTSSPASALHVVGASRTQRISSSYAYEWYVSSTNRYFLTDVTNAAERLSIDNAGNVGIGTSSPSAKLDIVGTSATEQFRIGNTTGSTDFGITVTENLSAIINSAEGATGRGIQFQSGGTNTLLIDSSGNVGIGTSAGITTVSSGLAINNATAGNYPGLEIQTAGVTRLFLNANNAESYISSAGTNPLVFYTNSAERMRIDSSGNFQTYCVNAMKPAYACRAWVSFNGTGTPAIRASGNVSSIGDNGTGHFTINFTTAMPDGNYAIFTGASTTNPQDQSIVANTATPSTGSYRMKTGFGGTLADYAYTFTGVFR